MAHPASAPDIGGADAGCAMQLLKIELEFVD